MLCFFIPGWSEAERGRIAHALFELGVRLGIGFTVVSHVGLIPAEARVVRYSQDTTGADALPCAWGRQCGSTTWNGRTLWAASSENGAPDVVAGVAELLSAAHEQHIGRDAFDRLGRIRPERHPLARAGLLTTSLVEEAAAWLGEHLRASGPELDRISRPWPSGARRAIVLSHDVDGPRLQKPRILARYLAYGFFMGARDGRASFLFGAATRLFRRPDPQWTFAQWRKLEESYGLRSTFFVYPGATAGRRDIRDPEYEPTEARLAEELRALVEGGWEIAAHTGLRARDAAAHLAGSEQLARISGQGTITGARAHYWGRDWLGTRQSWRALDDAGVSYDAGANPSTLGFRFGTSLPFLPSFLWRGGDCEGLLVLPTAIMDSYAVRRTSPLTPQALEAALDAIEKACAMEDGFLMLDWHERVLANLGVWRGFMAPLLERLNSWRGDTGICFLTASQAAQCWRLHIKRCYVGLENFPAVRT